MPVLTTALRIYLIAFNNGRIVIFIFKGNDGCLGTFYLSSIVIGILKTRQGKNSPQSVSKKKFYNIVAVDKFPLKMTGKAEIAKFCQKIKIAKFDF